MINKESKIVKQFIVSVFEATHKDWYVVHALDMIGSEENMLKIIEYIKDNKDIDWQDIEYNIIMLQPTLNEEDE